MAEKVNIGQTIREEMDRTGRTVTWLSRQLGTNRMACYRIFNSYSIDTQMLLRISVLLGRDFFTLYSEALKQEQENPVENQ
ncbi:MAG: XRE family transcriptional regulator [Bacteroidales bacterium]|nr:XRE family transcriptional regulator [Bacteroidales bacterium]